MACAYGWVDCLGVCVICLLFFFLCVLHLSVLKLCHGTHEYCDHILVFVLFACFV